MQISLSEAKANLSNIINRVYLGEEITITKHNLPVAEIIAYKPKKKQNIHSAFGVLTDNVDGLELQNTLRAEW
jgi:prevent-host-death family protein